MKTLREVGVFVGIPQDSAEFGIQSPIGLGYVRHLLIGGSSSNNVVPFSMQEAIQQLESLPLIKLDAKIVGPTDGEEPFKPIIRIGSSPGLIISTRVHYELGHRLVSIGEKVGAAGGDIAQQIGGPGSWTLKVVRSGIDTTGYKKLEKRLHVFIHSQPEPNPNPEPDPGAQNPTRPVIFVTNSQIGADSVTFTVSGTDFLRDQPYPGITIRIVDKMDFTTRTEQNTGSDQEGKIGVEINSIDIRFVKVNPFDGKRAIVISATDSRKDPNSVPANEPLWSEPVEIDLSPR